MYDAFLIESEQELNESNVRKVLQVIRGLLPCLRSIGFISAVNHTSTPSSNDYNTEQNERLRNRLIEGQYRFNVMSRLYGSNELTFMVHNIAKESLLHLAIDFKQEFIIYAERFEVEDRKNIKFEYLSQKGEELGIRNVDILSDDGEHLISQYKGLKFKLPFVDVLNKMHPRIYYNYTQVQHSEQGRTNEIKAVAYRVDDEGNSHPIPQEDIDKLEELQEKSFRQVGYTAYMNRGRIQQMIKNIIAGKCA